MEYLTIDPKDPYFVSGCKEAYKRYKVDVSDQGRLDIKRGSDGELLPCIIAGDMHSYQNYIDIEYKENDFGNMMNLFDMLKNESKHSAIEFEKAFQTSIDYVMPNPVVTKRRTNLEKSASDFEYAFMSHGDLTDHTPLVNPPLGTVMRITDKLGGCGVIYLQGFDKQTFEARKNKLVIMCALKGVIPRVELLPDGDVPDSPDPTYYGHNGIKDYVLNGFALELNIFHPTVASNFIHSTRENAHGNKCVLYKNGDKDLMLEYAEKPEYFRYHKDAYFSVYGKYYTKLSTPDYAGFYNIVTTRIRHDFLVVQELVTPLPVDVRNYFVDRYVEIDVYSPACESNVKTFCSDDDNATKGHVFHVVRPEARECRDGLMNDVARVLGTKVLKPSYVEKPRPSFYTVGGSTSLYRYTPEKGDGVKNEFYSKYEIIPSSVIVDNTSRVINIPYIVRRGNSWVKNKRPSVDSRYIHEEVDGVHYLIESFEDVRRKMVHPLFTHWYEFDGILRVVYDHKKGDFLCEKHEGDNPTTYSNAFFRTYVEQKVLDGISIPYVSYPKFIHALSGTYQDHYSWMEHRMVLTANTLVPSLENDKSINSVKHQDSEWDFLVDYLNGMDNG